MSVNIGNEASKIIVYKDEKGNYKTYIKGTEVKQDGAIEDVYMSKKLQFKKGVELKNKTTIEVKKGWNTCYRIKTEEVNEKGEPKYKYFDKYFILEFDLLEDGIDIPIKAKKEEIVSQNDFFINNDELPF